ncbi:MAG TPA: alpha-ketoacid dehydrogenase subunit beta, partial [Planctomycetota bacterium]|nr:alpha-ketoacid dehydrogenase subunit beta [Planctomycetota bacterium]
MPKLTIVGAVNDALRTAMREDDRVVVFGEDVGKKGGVFGATDKLQQEFGEKRCFDTPLSEDGIVGTAIGMAMNGLRPVAEIQFQDFIYPAFDQIVNELAKMRYRSGGEYTAPVVIRTPYGGGIRGGLYHSQSAEAYFAHTAGLQVVIPSTPRDTKGLLLSALRGEDPVIFLEPKRIYRDPTLAEDVPEGAFEVAIGEARTVREGADASVFAYGAMVPVCMQAAARAAEQGRELEVVDLRTLAPLDEEAVLASVRKTGRAIVVHEAPKFCGYGGEIAALIA